MRRVRAVVTGRVQGVSYRASTVDEARRLGLVGWVRNNDVDGSVELEAEGEPAQVDALLAWCKHGPPSARVDRVTTEDLAPTGTDTTFSVTR